MTGRTLSLGCATALVATLCVLYGFGWMLSRPVPADIGPPPAALSAEAVTFPSQSGSMIHGWLAPAPASRGAVLLLGGIRANRLSMVRRAEFLRRAGYSSLLIDLQATGESAGTAITFGWRERFDVLAGVQYLKTRLPGQPVGVIGVSLGGAATLLATPPLDLQAAVLESVYPSIDRAVFNRLRMRIGPLATPATPLLLFQLRTQLQVRPADLRPVDHIGKLGCPVLIIGGQADLHTTLEDTAMLFAAAQQPKELWILPAAAHVDYLEVAGDAYRQRVLAFVATAFSRAQPVVATRVSDSADR